MKLIIKVCGMRRADNINEVDALGPDLMGFIFYEKSSRYVSDMLPSTRAGRVGVFVNADCSTILSTGRRYSLGVIQLHGDESPELCREIRTQGFKVIKAISVAGSEDLEKTGKYAGCCDYLLFDTKCAGYGGSGEPFDWRILEKYDGPLEFLLSGGITENDLSSILELADNPWFAGIDLNSRFEIAPALKDTVKLKRFIDSLRKSKH